MSAGSKARKQLELTGVLEQVTLHHEAATFCGQWTFSVVPFSFFHQHALLPFSFLYSLLYSTRLFVSSLLQNTDQIGSGALTWLEFRKLACPSTSTERSVRLFYMCFGRLVWIWAGEEMMCAEQADNLLERGSEGVCCETVSCEAVISVCDDARVRVDLYLLVCMSRTQVCTSSTDTEWCVCFITT